MGKFNKNFKIGLKHNQITGLPSNGWNLGFKTKAFVKNPLPILLPIFIGKYFIRWVSANGTDDCCLMTVD